jgi:hypothetical protein
LWGTESAWRIPLNNLFDAQVIVFWEHVLILAMFMPLLLPRLGEIRRIEARTWGYLIFSGFAGSAVGTVFFTLALKWQSDGRKRDPQHSAAHLNIGCISVFRRSAYAALFSLCDHRHRGRHFPLC